MNISKLFSFEPVEFAKDLSPEKMLLGIFLGLLFGMIGSIPWIIVGYLGIFTSILGFIIGLAAYKGFTFGAGKMHIVGILTIIVSILIAIPLSEMIILFMDGVFRNDVDVITAITLTPEIFFEFFAEFVPNILLGYLFAFIGAWRIIRN